MKKHPNVGSKVENTIKYDYVFTIGEYEKYLKDNIGNEVTKEERKNWD